jgi:hypothetical protein
VRVVFAVLQRPAVHHDVVRLFQLELGPFDVVREIGFDESLQVAVGMAVDVGHLQRIPLQLLGQGLK